MDAHRRQELARVAAPVAFLLVATKHTKTHAASAVVPVATGTTTSARVLPSTTPAGTSTASGKTYTVAAGDTLGSIATKEHTTVDALLAANPGIDPTGLQIGDTISLP
jgi:LysM repeat protein